jgi:hypothetical protein
LHLVDRHRTSGAPKSMQLPRSGRVRGAVWPRGQVGTPGRLPLSSEKARNPVCSDDEEGSGKTSAIPVHTTVESSSMHVAVPRLRRRTTVMTKVVVARDARVGQVGPDRDGGSTRFG